MLYMVDEQQELGLVQMRLQLLVCSGVALLVRCLLVWACGLSSMS
jgi:hypothetical protein